ncbi:transglutaminase family protein [Roseinatronobacter alkalisoli]|uniref:Transglutaminase family protein n=1 Tax=Roseinatronobacter alkalisoli TaxID=3028235 RepID=A0ABT5TEV1_9RHOB|nr:transglutaminase family protein [Roseinatronobacter sp. HJB301]MDD7973645.1 transglutaminase family protein [Roseinatronobacter sp. HJB301]
MIRIFVSLVFALWSATAAFADIRTDVRDLFASDLETLDFARVKTEVDRMIDPSIDVDAQLAQIDQMVTTIETMLPPDADSWAKVETIRRYIYQPGPWNDGNAFSYDHDDPYGLDVRNKLLSDYIQDRRGNCITMPFLFIILGQRLGLDVVPAMAPLHVFVKFTDDAGKTWNLEATSGAGAARDQHYRDLLPITDEAIANGVFLAPLSNEQSIAVIAAVVVEELIAQDRYHDAMAVADILIEHYPMFAYIMVKKATASYHLLRTEFHEKYPTAQDVPEDQRPYLAYLQRVNQSMFDRAEFLGWRALQR